MRMRILAISAVLGLAGAGTCAAEDLIEIYDLAVQSDPVLKEAEQSLYATREVKPQAKSLLLPNFSLVGEGTYQNLKSSGNSSLGRFNRNDTFGDSRATAVVNQTIYNRGDWISLDRTNNVIAQAEAGYRDSEIELMVRTTRAYFDVLQAADLVRVNEALVRANERQLEQSKQRFEVGLVAITDVNESQAAYDRTRADLINAQNALDNTWEALRQIVGPISVPLARLGEKLPLAPPEPNDVEQWVETAMKNNYAVAAAEQAAAAAKKQIEVERSGHYPTLGLQAGYDLARSGAQFNTDTDNAYVGLQLTVPLYQGGLVTSRTRQAGYDLGAAQERLDQRRRQVVNNVNNAFRGILSSISDVKARQAAIVSARSALESTQAGLEVGTRTQVDVLNAQRNLYQAEYDYLRSRYGYIINGVLLHQATSTLTRDVLAKGNAWLNPSDTVAPPAY
jgi:outer membrane protein